MDGRSRLARLAACGALLTLLIAAPAHAGARPGAAGFVDAGTLTLVSNGSPADLDPASNQSDAADMVARTIAEPLINVAPGTLDRYLPGLASSWDTNRDQSVWTFHLRHGVRFHTGRCCLVADDVRYSIGRTITANLAAAYVFGRFLSDPFKQIQVVDPYTVRFNFGRPQPIFLAAISSDYTGLILDAQALRAHEKKHDWGHAWASENDAGTGPYSLKRWEHSQQITLSRFPGYWNNTGSHFSSVILRTVPDATTRRELIERGQADITFDLTPQDYDALKQNPQVHVVSGYGTEVTYFIMTEAGPLASPLARQALSYAFNYDALIKGIYRGYARRAYGPLAGSLLGFDPGVFQYHTDLNKARALLQQAGVPSGTKLTFAYYDPYGAGAPILQAQLAQLGINLELQHLDEGAFNTLFYGDAPAASRPNLMGFAWWPDYNDPYDEITPILAGASAGSAGSNGGFYKNKAVDQLLAAMKFGDRATLTRNAKTLQDITSRQDPPAIWTAEPAQVTILSAKIKGFVFSPGDLRTYDFNSLTR